MRFHSLACKILSFCLIAGLLLAVLPGSTVGAQSSTLTLKPVADAYVNRSNENRNFGTRTTLSVDRSPVIRSFLRFDVRGLNGAKISKAVLRMYSTDGSHSGLNVSKVADNNWSETGITFNNAPSAGSSIGSVGSYGTGVWIQVDVTAAVTGEGSLNLALTTSADTTTALASREAGANAPQLVLTLGSTAAPTATSTQVTAPTKTASVQPTVIAPAWTSTVNPTAAPTAVPTQQPTAVSTNAPASVPTQSSQPMPFGVPGTWTLKFSDDFNGTQLDLNKWEPNWLAGNDTAITKPINGAELSCYDPAQVSVVDGSLKLSAVSRSCRANNGTTYNYASGIVTSRPHYTFSYGYMEARVWMDGSSNIANWPAFWADGTGDWPTTGEIDVMEGLEGRPSWHYHWGTNSNHRSAGGYPTMSSKVGWHTFGADWQPGYVKFYYDGVYVGQATEGIVSGPMFLILNYGLSTEISPPVQVPSHFLVDYVRVWQK